MVNADGTPDLVGAVNVHTALFNACVRSGDWTPFVATFTQDARMLVTNAPGGPLVGREAIAGVYAARPPREAMRLVEIEPVDTDTVRVRFDWESGRAGSMVVRWRGDLVQDVELTL
ncbi:nuclear transport factor 2 family protein [Solwaraspora sp. WMMD1047]|uniref:nuclear transport factor 2 family protein n=1 Tax=Solwaraspora sp. WMMD1047 TaxID=3016102 RepID=UPI0024163F05|nr:nuclear transport factor 2 family protein [Solwaraspora sp. WMMD1047]MDG4831714.1 nuclear transport factor 2 family protein [Solwaraspora sp. WMMD1047]